jgi:hypothetical protein
MKRFIYFNLTTRGLLVLFTLEVTLILCSAIPGYYYSASQAQTQVQQQPPPPAPPRIGIKITSPSTGQQVPVGELTISGISTDNATTDCTVYADWNNTKPLQTAVATGPAGVNDYSRWTFTYTDDYHLITNGTNDLTSKLTCVDDSTGGTTNLTQFYSVNVIGVAGTTTATPTNNSASTTSTSEEVQQQQQSPIMDRNITTIMEEITNVTTTTSPESVPSISTSPSVPFSPSINEQQQQEDTTIYWDIE